MVTTPKAGDLTGRRRAEQQKALAQEVKDRQEEIAVAHAIEQEAIENEVLDVTGSNAEAPVVIDEVEELVDDATVDAALYTEVRVAEDVQEATIASHEGIRTYNFQAGRKYRVPANVAFVLKERGLLYDRA